MKMAEVLMKEAKGQGLGHFFGIPGGGIPLDLMEVGRQLGVRFVNMSHESSAAIAAAYYGLLKNTAGLALGVRGVGAGNLAGGAANVYFERLPLVAICEAIPNSTIKHETVQRCDQEKLFVPVSKFQSLLTPDEPRRVIQEAFFQATDGRPGPAILHVPSDISEVKADSPHPSGAAKKSVLPDEAEFARLREILKKSQHPVILAGADIARAGATAELLELAETMGAAVLVTMDARGVFPESHPRWAGVYVGFFNPNVIETRVLAKADIILLAGVDALMTHGPWKSSAPTCELAARAEYSTLSSPMARLNGDLKLILRRVLVDQKSGFSEAEIQELRRGILSYFRRPGRARLATQDIIEITRELLPPEGALFSETGAFICLLEHLWPVTGVNTYFGTSGGRTMGLMVPAIIGARLADPVRPMVGIGGDGSLLMRLGELEVLARMQVAVPLIIINDQALGTIKSRQQARGFPDYGLDFHPVDFGAIARAFGLRGVTVETPEEFRQALREAFKAERATLIDARVDPAAYQGSFGATIGIVDSPV